ncbi:hypothetical protein DRO61_12865 [Candidatus Bathyarchaeota archaeon]|nr:MAG: hypothetical protein DRO61_12865 [Candidatus Bathyarchaeota archaeon]
MAHYRLNDFLKLSPEERRQKTFSNVNEKRFYGKRNFSKEEITTYLTLNELDSSRKLVDFRKDNEPTVYDCVKAFGSWKETKREVFGSGLGDMDDMLNGEPECDAEYLVKVIIENNLSTWREYLEARKKRPDIIPSSHQIRKNWKRFSDLINFAEAYSIKHVAVSFLVLKRKLGRIPTKKDCEEAGINLERVMETFGGKREFDTFIKNMELIQNAIKE